MWFQRREVDLKYLAHEENDVVRVVVEEELEHLSCGAATGLAVEFIEPASAADVIKSVAIGLVIDGTKCVVIGQSLLK